MDKTNRKLLQTARCLIVLSLVVLMAVGCAATNTSPGANPTPDQTVETPNNVKTEKMVLTLYFATKNASNLVAEKREVAKTTHPARTAMEELIVGPKNAELEKVVPAATKLRDVKIKNHVAYVDFSEDFVKGHWGGTAGEIITTSAIINTLTEFSDIKRVQFMVEGKNLETLTGHLDLREPLQRNEAIIKNIKNKN
jgi:germination protein M